MTSQWSSAQDGGRPARRRARTAALLGIVLLVLLLPLLAATTALVDSGTDAPPAFTIAAPRPGDQWVYNVSVLRFDNGSATPVPDPLVQVQAVRGGATTAHDAEGRPVAAEALQEVRHHRSPATNATWTVTFRHDVDPDSGVSYQSERERHVGIASASLSATLPGGGDVADGEREYRVETFTSYGGSGPLCGQRSTLQQGPVPFDATVFVAGACGADGRGDAVTAFRHLGADALGGDKAQVYGPEQNESAVQLWFRADLPVPAQVSIALDEEDHYRVYRLVHFARDAEEPPLWSGPAAPLPARLFALRGPLGPDATGVEHPFPLTDADQVARGDQAVAEVVARQGAHLIEAAYREVHQKAEADRAAEGPYPGIDRSWTLTYSDGEDAVKVRVVRQDAERHPGRPETLPTLPGVLRDTATPPEVTLLTAPEGPFPDEAVLPPSLPTVASVRAAWEATGGALADPEQGLAYGFAYHCSDARCGAAVAEVWVGDDHRVQQQAGVNVGAMATEEYLSTLTVDQAGRLVQAAEVLHVEETYTETPLFTTGTPPGPARHPVLQTGSVQEVEWFGPFAAPAVALTALSVVVALVYYLWPSLKAWFAGAFFHRDTPDLLANPTRGGIYGRIQERPGIHHKELMRAVGHGNHVLRHHLRRLQDAGLVSVSRGTGYTCYFPTGKIDRRLMAAAPVLKTEVSARVLHHAVQAPGVTAGEVATALGVAPATISYHLNRLKAAGLIEVVAEGRRRTVRPTALGEAALRGRVAAT